MAYFTDFPDILLPSFTDNRNSSTDFVRTKNLFKRAKIRDDIFRDAVAFEEFAIQGDDRPDNVAFKAYGDSNLDWVVLLSNNILNIRDEWPLSPTEIYNYSEKKYGSGLNDVRYYITKEIRDSEGHLILPQGKVVNSDFTVKYYDNILSSYQTRSGTSVRTGVSNYEHETKLNEDKRFIFIIKGDFLQEFLNDFRDIMVYGKSSQFVNDKTVKTENLNITMP